MRCAGAYLAAQSGASELRARARAALGSALDDGRRAQARRLAEAEAALELRLRPREGSEGKRRARRREGVDPFSSLRRRSWPSSSASRRQLGRGRERADAASCLLLTGRTPAATTAPGDAGGPAPAPPNRLDSARRGPDPRWRDRARFSAAIPRRPQAARRRRRASASNRASAIPASDAALGSLMICLSSAETPADGAC